MISAFHLEVLAAIDGLVLGRNLGFSDIIVESDSQMQSKGCLEKDTNYSKMGNLFHRIKALTIVFNSISFSHVHRNENKPAHVLAK